MRPEECLVGQAHSRVYRANDRRAARRSKGTAMSTTYRDITNQVADQWVAALKNAEQLVGAVSEDAQRFAQAAPTASLPEFAAFEKLNEVISEQLPKPREIVEANFEFATRLLTAQRDL